jgi:prepilin peptidase CpaA
MNAPLWIAIPVVLLTVVATREDMRTRKIPNIITGPALLLGVGTHLVLGGPSGAVSALAGALVAGAVLFPGWLVKWMGAGDVKLMAAVGAWLTYPQALYAVLLSLVAGGLISIVVAVRRGILVRSLRGAALLIPGLATRVGRTGTQEEDSREDSKVYFPFAMAILAGSLFALWRPL